jgi:tellurite resistance protein
MSVIDRAMQELQMSAAERPPVTLSLPEAVAAVLVAAVSADGIFSVEEANRLNNVLSTSRLFQQAVRAGDVNVVERALNVLTERGLAPVLEACGAVVPPELRATVFAIATDLVLADGCIRGREKAFVDQLQAALEVDETTALKIVEVLLIKNRG